ncbi:DNA repair protein RecO [Gaopeijia maritima]|uniref:DNA repair protein RecO n=1 Tax=Gaopeijia maritima TaxID=3119007 RepID=A0ABU9E8Z5_9BACT
MSATHTAALLLRAHPYGETSRVLRFLTRDRGIVGVMARGVRSGKGSGLDTFAGGRLTYYHKSNRDLHTFKEFGVERPRRGLGRHPLRLAGASVLADLVLRHGGDADAESLFDSLSRALDDLADADPPEVPSVLLREGWGLIAVLGYHPSLERCPRCGEVLGRDEVGRFDFEQGGVRCARCAEEGGGGPRLGPVARAQLAALVSGTVPPELRKPRAHLRLLSDFVTYHLAGSRELASFRVLGALLPSDD